MTTPTTVDGTQRFCLHRAGVLNVWQYDEQVFEFAGGRMLLRGANGAGKSKTLEMLLPFVLDGDKSRMTASGKHHTSLLWLMTDGYDGQARVGYLWVEFVRGTPDGGTEAVTCGIGIRASQSARTASCWYFTTPRRVGVDLILEDDAGPLSKDRCREAVGPDGQLFDSPRQYKEHVGRTLFGLDVTRYEELLRLLYWLRQPQVGEDIEPAKLAGILSVALPEMDDAALRAAGDTFDELAAFGEQLERQRKAAEAMTAFATVYAGYARTVARAHGAALREDDREQRHRDSEVTKAQREITEITASITQAQAGLGDAEQRKIAAEARQRQLEASPEAQSERRLLELGHAATRAEQHATRSEQQVSATRARLDQAAERLAGDAQRITGGLRQLGADTHAALATGRRTGLQLELAVPPRVSAPVLADAADADPVVVAIHDFAAQVAAARPAIGERLAAVAAVDDARGKLVDAERTAAESERAAGTAERRADQAHGRRADADTAAGVEESAFRDRLDNWRAHESAQPFELPGELDATTVPTLPALARQAAEPRLAALRVEQADAASTRVGAERELDRLRERRARIEAERDPAPPPPALPRTPRDLLPGAPLWQLVAFAPSLDAAEAAGLEAALESSGLLDAWVRPDGAVLEADRLDVVLLPAGAPVLDASLADALLTDVPDSAGVTAETVRSVLSRVALVPTGTDPAQQQPEAASPGGEPPAAVSADGRWWLGPLAGRAAKQVAQYVGASARAAERLRRLAEVDAQLTETAARRDAAAAAEAAVQATITGVETWLDAFPPYAPLIKAWAHLDAAVEEAERAQADARAAHDAAEAARTLAAGHRTELHRLAESFELPVDADALAAVRDELATMDDRLHQAAQAATATQPAISSWQAARSAHDCDLAELDRLVAETGELRQQAIQARAASDTEQQKVGASVAQLQAALAEARGQIAASANEVRGFTESLRAASEARGKAAGRVEAAEQRRDEHAPLLVERAQAVAALADVPGLLAACAFDTDTHAEAVGLARGLEPGQRLPAPAVRLAEALAGLDVERLTDEAAVWRGHQELAAGPAADTEPRIVPVAGQLAALARDDTGEHPVAVLAARLQARVAQDRDLLTERERRLFEDHLLGDLGETLRSRRVEAEELVAAMNRLLSGVSTSQGIRVRLDWRLRDDVPDDARRAVTLLGKALGALLPEERRDLRDALHRLIEASRAEEPELSYTEHLSRSLDYRKWFAFRVRYTRPETPGAWHDLHRRSALSQGEQKVVCYLPLFAAAAAHFSSVAGAAPHAPRFVLLDDAFPKIDVRTHPLLFGLLVDLDLDFLITSERLWGDHVTVPSLAIYEALRDPSQRGIAQYRHTWDGQRLHAVGA